jgi:hypothetical protein
VCVERRNASHIVCGGGGAGAHVRVTQWLRPGHAEGSRSKQGVCSPEMQSVC